MFNQAAFLPDTTPYDQRPDERGVRFTRPYSKSELSRPMLMTQTCDNINPINATNMASFQITIGREANAFFCAFPDTAGLGPCLSFDVTTYRKDSPNAEGFCYVVPTQAVNYIDHRMNNNTVNKGDVERQVTSRLMIADEPVDWLSTHGDLFGISSDPSRSDCVPFKSVTDLVRDGSDYTSGRVISAIGGVGATGTYIRTISQCSGPQRVNGPIVPFGVPRRFVVPLKYLTSGPSVDVDSLISLYPGHQFKIFLRDAVQWVKDIPFNITSGDFLNLVPRTASEIHATVSNLELHYWKAVGWGTLGNETYRLLSENMYFNRITLVKSMTSSLTIPANGTTLTATVTVGSLPYAIRNVQAAIIADATEGDLCNVPLWVGDHGINQWSMNITPQGVWEPNLPALNGYPQATSLSNYGHTSYESYVQFRNASRAQDRDYVHLNAPACTPLMHGGYNQVYQLTGVDPSEYVPGRGVAPTTQGVDPNNADEGDIYSVFKLPFQRAFKACMDTNSISFSEDLFSATKGSNNVQLRFNFGPNRNYYIPTGTYPTFDSYSDLSECVPITGPAQLYTIATCNAMLWCGANLATIVETVL